MENMNIHEITTITSTNVSICMSPREKKMGLGKRIFKEIVSKEFQILKTIFGLQRSHGAPNKTQKKQTLRHYSEI